MTETTEGNPRILDRIDSLFDSDNLVTKTNLAFDPIRMSTDASKIVAKYPFKETRQLCLTHRQKSLGVDECIYEGTGRLEPGVWEFDFAIFNQEFQETYYAEIHKALSQKFRVGRMRLALLPPRQCYSMHIDASLYRYHIAVTTNKFCFITYYEGEMLHIPADGFVYKMNTRLRHSAFNGGQSDRIHLLLELMPKKPRIIHEANYCA